MTGKVRMLTTNTLGCSARREMDGGMTGLAELGATLDHEEDEAEEDDVVEAWRESIASALGPSSSWP